jgi:putative endonuclease
MSDKKGYVYILFSRQNGTLYTGVTSDLLKRLYEHKNKSAAGFTSRYGVDKLGYYEVFESIIDAIAREKQIKGGSRKKKLELIEKGNPEWRDLYEELL